MNLQHSQAGPEVSKTIKGSNYLSTQFALNPNRKVAAFHLLIPWPYVIVRNYISKYDKIWPDNSSKEFNFSTF